MAHSTHKLIPESYDPGPLAAPRSGRLRAGRPSAAAQPPWDISSPWTARCRPNLAWAGRPWQPQGSRAPPARSLVLPREDATAVVAVGAGDGAARTADELRDGAAAFARAAARHGRLALVLPAGHGLDGALAAQAAVEGALLARYRFNALQTAPKDIAVASLEVVGAGDGAQAGAARGKVLARSAALARDLANNPPGHLTATEYADFATEQGPAFGLGVETFDKAALIEMGCGGLLGVNAGSVEEPRLIVLRYVPAGRAHGAPGPGGQGHHV